MNLIFLRSFDLLLGLSLASEMLNPVAARLIDMKMKALREQMNVK